MNSLTKEINNFFKYATKAQIKEVLDSIEIDEHQAKVIDMFYKKHLTISRIGMELGFSEGKIKKDLETIKKKVAMVYGSYLYKSQTPPI